MSIAIQLVRSIEDAIAGRGVRQVERVDVQIGAGEMVVPDALRMAFEVVATGTVAEGAELVLTEIPLVVTCRRCGQQFEPKAADYVCPGCGQADVDITGGRDILLTSLQCTTAEETASS